MLKEAFPNLNNVPGVRHISDTDYAAISGGRTIYVPYPGTRCDKVRDKLNQTKEALKTIPKGVPYRQQYVELRNSLQRIYNRTCK